MSANETVTAKLDAEDAASAIRFWDRDLDRIIARMRGDADYLEKHGQYAGATMTRGVAREMEDTLRRLRDARAELERANTVLNHTSGIQR